MDLDENDALCDLLVCVKDALLADILYPSVMRWHLFWFIIVLYLQFNGALYYIHTYPRLLCNLIGDSHG